MIEEIAIYTDGGARGNPGPAGAGAVVFHHGKIVREGSRFLGVMTNNEAEYEAVLLGLSLAKTSFGKKTLKEKKVAVYLDSELVTRQLNKVYQVKEPRLFPYFVGISNLCITDFPNISFHHIPREKNKDADRLANSAMDRGEE